MGVQAHGSPCRETRIFLRQVLSTALIKQKWLTCINQRPEGSFIKRMFQAVTRALTDRARTIRIPVDMVDRISQVQGASQTLVQAWGREPTPAELGRELGLSVAQVLEARQIAQHTISLETPLSEDGDLRVGDTLADHQTRAPSDELLARDVRARTEEVLRTLTFREREIIRRRFGIPDGSVQTLAEVGQIFGLTRERIRQVEAIALRKLRAPDRCRTLRVLLDA